MTGISRTLRSLEVMEEVRKLVAWARGCRLLSQGLPREGDEENRMDIGAARAGEGETRERGAAKGRAEDREVTLPRRHQSWTQGEREGESQR